MAALKILLHRWAPAPCVCGSCGLARAWFRRPLCGLIHATLHRARKPPAACTPNKPYGRGATAKDERCSLQLSGTGADEGAPFSAHLARTTSAETVARKCLDPLVERVREFPYRSSNAYVIYDTPSRILTKNTPAQCQRHTGSVLMRDASENSKQEQ